MANEEHLAKLMEGVEAWNKWRLENPRIIASLGGANLSSANLIGADLSGANLIGANLSGAYLHGAQLSGADLSGADLGDTDLSDTDLSGADLSDTDLPVANLSRADLGRADLSGANLLETVLGATDLSGSKNLEKCNFHGPCVIDNRTIRQSWPLPERFLKGCGLSDWEIEAAKLHQEGLSLHDRQEITHRMSVLAIEQTPIEFHSCFISYNSKDEEIAKKIHEGLDKKGVRSFFAPVDLRIGSRFRQVIADEIRKREKLLVILSSNSIESPEVAREVRRGLREEDRTGKAILFPIRLDDSVFETSQEWAEELHQERHIGDFTNWQDDAGFNNAFDRLIRDLEKAAQA